MTILGRTHDQALKWLHRNIPTQLTPEGRILIFADVALGDLCFLLPVINALKDRPHTVVCNNPDRQEVIRLLTPHVESLESLPAIRGDYGTVICNFQQQWTTIVKKVLNLKIPCRIGHWWREKYQWVFNQKIPYLTNYHRHIVNEWLLWPFGIHYPEPVKLEVPNPALLWDVLIAPFSDNGIGNKDWVGHGAVEKILRSRGYRVGAVEGRWDMKFLCRAIAGSKLVIGNDSGLPKLADAMGVPAIQIHLNHGPCEPRVSGVLHGQNLTDPTVDEVVNLARKILERKGDR